ncbi:MAG: hypothetical protein U1E52_03605 [Geminicoccaceae bacterium]
MSASSLEGMAVSHDGRWAVTTSEDHQHGPLDRHRDPRDRRTNTWWPSARATRSRPTTRLLWATSEIGGAVTVIDAATHEPVHEVRFAIGVAQDLVQPVGFLAVARRHQGVRGAGPGQPGGGDRHRDLRRSRNTSLVGRRVWHLDLTPDGSTLLTTNGLTNDVSVIDVASLEVVRSTPVGRMPWGVASPPVTATATTKVRLLAASAAS